MYRIECWLRCGGAGAATTKRAYAGTAPAPATTTAGATTVTQHVCAGIALASAAAAACAAAAATGASPASGRARKILQLPVPASGRRAPPRTGCGHHPPAQLPVVVPDSEGPEAKGKRQSGPDD